MARTVMLWRHGRTAWNLENRFQGHSDVPLDDVGRQQAAAAAAILARHRPQRIVSSDLGRAVQTAAMLAELAGVPVEHDSALREAFADQWEGLTREQILQDHAEQFWSWHRDPRQRAGGGGETRGEVAARVARAVAQGLAGLSDGATAVFVTHGGAARAGLGLLLGLPLESWQRLVVLRNCAWAELEHDGDDSWRLRGYNLGADPVPPNAV